MVPIPQLRRIHFDLVCVAVLIIILCLGLSPFHSPANDVSWLGYCNGLAIGKTGGAIAVRPIAKVQNAALSPTALAVGSTALVLYCRTGPAVFDTPISSRLRDPQRIDHVLPIERISPAPTGISDRNYRRRWNDHVSRWTIVTAHTPIRIRV
jgi:hypothetical protein